MKSNPILEAIAVFVSLAASASISIDAPDDKPVATTVTEKTVNPPPLTSPVVTTTDTRPPAHLSGLSAGL
jgi:hypothetical protein